MLKFMPTSEKDKWEFRCKCDSDYAGDKGNRLSVTGYSIYINGYLISWKSRAHKCLTLSSTEAEYMALCEICCKILFVKMILEFLGEKIEYPITVYAYYEGAIYLAYNAEIAKRTKHVDTMTHFVRHYVEDGTIKIKFVRSEDNEADIFTKKTTESTYDKHTSKFIIVISVE